MRKSHRVFPLLYLSALAASVASEACFASATITVIGQEYHGRYNPGLTLSADGSTVVGRFGDAGQLWRLSTGIQLIPPQVGTERFIGLGVDASGDAIAGTSFVSSQSGTYIPSRWTVSGGVQSVGVLAGNLRDAFGISSDGSVVAGEYATQSPSATHAFRWTAATGATDIGTCYEVSGLSGDGSTTIGAQINPSSRVYPVRWTASGMQDLGLPTSLSNEGHAYGTNADGSVVTGYYAASGHNDAFIWTPSSGIQALPHLPGCAYARAFAVSGDGSTIVGIDYQNSGGVGVTGFFWTPQTGTVNLGSFLASSGADMTGWSAIWGAYGVSGDGTRVVGLGSYNGVDTAFVATIPTPTSVAPFAVGCVLATRRRRR